MMDYLVRPKTVREFPVRKPDAVPPKTNTIQKFAEGGLSNGLYL